MQPNENDLKNQIDFHRFEAERLENDLNLLKLCELKKDLKQIYIEFRTGDDLKDHILPQPFFTNGRRYWFKKNEIQKLIEHLEKLK